MAMNQNPAPEPRSLARSRLLLECDLDNTAYFQSLLRAATLQGLIAEKELEIILSGCFSLLTAQTQRYAGVENSSIPIEKAQELMNSILYTISAVLLTENDPDAALTRLRETPSKVLFREGQSLLRRHVDICRVLFKSVQNSRIPTPNIAYRDTLDHGLSPFFKSYDSDFFATEIPVMIDYPLCVDEMRLQGVAYFRDFLEKLLLENRFCACFRSTAIHHMMLGVDFEYPDLLLNLFEQTLANALGCVLSGEPPETLSVTPQALKRLADLFSGLLAGNAAPVLQKALERLLPQLGLGENQALARYAGLAVEKIASNVETFLATGHLSTVFVTAQ